MCGSLELGLPDEPAECKLLGVLFETGGLSVSEGSWQEV
jgi:hypothetical protein